MKTNNQILEKLEYSLDVLTVSVFLLLLLISVYAIIDVNKVNRSAILDKQVTELAPEDDDSDIDFDELRSINPEILAWIKINNTNINYPVVQSKDNKKYLVRDYKEEYSAAGSIFLDYRNNGFNDDYSLVYGHRMSGDIMFGGIHEFEDATYFDTHTDGVLYTEDAVYDLSIISYSVVNIGQTQLYDLARIRNNNNDQILQEALTDAVNYRDVEVSADDKLILLSTCDKDSNHYRDVILAKMITIE